MGGNGMRVFVFILFITVFIVKPVYPAQENIVPEDRELIAMETFPVYQRNDNFNVISNIKPGDRIRSILSYSDSPNWILVKTPENWMGWVDRTIIDLFTRPPSLDMGEYVKEGQADLDGDGVDEFIQIVPGSWLESRSIFINGIKTDVATSDDQTGFCVVDSISSDKYKEVLITSDGSKGRLYSYRNGNLDLADYSWRISRMDGHGIRFENKHLHLGEARSKSILSAETGRFEEIGQKIFYISL